MQAQNASGTIDANFNLVRRTVGGLLDGFLATFWPRKTGCFGS